MNSKTGTRIINRVGAHRAMQYPSVQPTYMTRLSKVLPKKITLPTDRRLGWFDLGRYESLSSLGPAGWYFQIAIRAACFQGIYVNSSIHDDKHQREEWIRTRLSLKRRDLAGIVKRNPCVVPRTIELLRPEKNQLFEFVPRWDGIVPTSSSAIRSATIEELYLTEMVLDESVKVRARKFFRECEESTQDAGLKSPLHEVNRRKLGYTIHQAATDNEHPLHTSMIKHSRMESRLDLRQSTYFLSLRDDLHRHRVLSYDNEKQMITVDLSRPEQEILEAFKTWLRTTRSVQGTKKKTRPKQEKGQNWVKRRVIPYLDLRIWPSRRV